MTITDFLDVSLRGTAGLLVYFSSLTPASAGLINLAHDATQHLSGKTHPSLLHYGLDLVLLSAGVYVSDKLHDPAARTFLRTLYSGKWRGTRTAEDIARMIHPE